MEKKKNDKNFIIPAKFFGNSIVVEEKIDVPQKVVSKIIESKATITQPKIEIPVLKTARKRTSSLSIKSIHRKNELEEEEVVYVDYSNMPKTEFTEVDLIRFWKQHHTNLLKDGKKIIASIIGSDRPKLDGHNILMTLPNKRMQSQLEEHKPILLKYIRKELNNYSIDLLIEVNEIQEKKYAYTSQEKYEKLKEKNPFIAEFRKTLDLEV